MSLVTIGTMLPMQFHSGAVGCTGERPLLHRASASCKLPATVVTQSGGVNLLSRPSRKPGPWTERTATRAVRRLIRARAALLAPFRRLQTRTRARS